MANGRAKVGDKVVGICVHSGSPFVFTGSIISGNDKVLKNGTADARIGDKVRTNCPSCVICTIIEGSMKVLSGGNGTTVLGHKVNGPSAANGSIISGSNKVITG
jgi:uncharacterized Zn-binding protein involved in type VI secretion